MTKRGIKVRHVIGICSMLFGFAMVFCAGYIVDCNIRESVSAGTYIKKVSDELDELIKASPAQAHQSSLEFIPDYVIYPEMTMPEQNIDGNPYIGELYFPTLGMYFAVQSEYSMANLAKSPCRYSGTAYDDNAFVICAHNYTTHFWPLRKLSSGDEVVFTDCDGNVFEYAVVYSEQISPSPVTQVTESDYDLVLFTCSLNGTKRIAIFCNSVTDLV